MLGSLFRRVPEAEVLDRDGERLLLRVSGPVAEGTEPSFRLRLPDGSLTGPVQLAVESCRALASSGHLLVAFSTRPDDLGEFSAAAASDAGLRQAPRIECRICVVSRDLPGYRGITVDYSRSGIQLETAGVLEPGSNVLVRLEFGVDTLPSLECQARVAWCTRQARSHHRVGLQFVDLEARARDILERFESILLKRDETSILHRLLFGDDHGQEPIPAAARSHRPDIQAISGTIHEGVVEGYTVQAAVTTVVLRRPGDRLVEYRFQGQRGLSDFGATSGGAQVADLVERPCATAGHRFSFVDRFGKPVLEVVASSADRVAR